MRIGYARVSTQDQNLDLQIDDLTKAGCKKIYEDKVSGSRAERPGLAKALEMLREEDTLVVWKLDRLGRSVKNLVDLVGELHKQGIHLTSLTDAIDTGVVDKMQEKAGTYAMTDMPDPLSHAPPAPAAPQGSDTLATSELRYRRLFETARDGILILDSKEGKITDANPFMTELLGYSHDELIGKELWEIGLLRDKDASQEAFQRLTHEGYIRYEDLPLENQRGERREVEFVSNLYPENGRTVIQCNIRDITERKAASVQLAAAAAEAGRQAAVLAVIEERTRLAREIHDTLAQGFIGITTQLEAAEAALAKIPELATPENIAAYQTQVAKAQVRIGKARDLARESLAEARHSVAVLRSSPSEMASLSETLADYLSQEAFGKVAKSHYVSEGVPYVLPFITEHCLLRIGKEAIVNAVEHAAAQEITVGLFFEVERVRLCVRDDGRGFDPDVPGAGRFGIIGMQERAAKVGGQLVVVSRPGVGTEVSLSVPVSGEALADE